MIRVVAIVAVSFAAGVPAGYFLAVSWGAGRQAQEGARDFFKPLPKKDHQDYQGMRPRW